MTNTIQQILSSAITQLEPVTDSPRADSEILICHVLGCNRSYLHTWPEKPVTNSQQVRITRLIGKRQQGEPVAYLVGQRSFWEFELKVSNDTLIPRADTELLVEQALLRIPLHHKVEVLELGTGTGAIALAIAHERPDSHIDAVEQSTGALAIAGKNIERYSRGNIKLINSNWFSALGDKRYHMIVSNPPYIAQQDPHLETGDVRYEPRSALTAGTDGLDAIRHIIQTAPEFLIPGGQILIEHGYDQADPVKCLFLQQGFNNILQFKDLGGHLRVSLAEHPL